MKIRNARIELWAHLVSAHATVIPFTWTMGELELEHGHEHKGPGTIRGHDSADRSYSLKKMGEVLAEADEQEVGP